jgi:predicted RecA/RadA family phage recombinase
MANNFKYSGKRVYVAPTAALASGVLSRVTGFIGIPMGNCAVGASVAFALEGVWGMTYTDYGAYQPAIGSILYWNIANAKLSIGAGNNDFPCVKVVTAISATDGSFDGLLLPQNKPYGQANAG